MKALWFTDLHLRPNQKDAGEKALRFILDTAAKQKPDVAICTGDVFHTKNIIYGTMMDMFQDFLIELGKICPIWVIPGNHDYCVEYEVHALAAFKLLPNVTIVDDAAKITDKVGIVAYARQEERFQALLKKLGPVEYLFGHFDINGFNLGSGWEERESWSDPSKFQGVKKVFSGHYHLHQSKQLGDIEFVYCGTSYTTAFDESDQEKYIALVDLETGEWNRIQTGLTLHKTLRINAGDPFPEIPETSFAEGVEYRVVVKGTQQQIGLLDKPKNYQARISYDFISDVGERLDVSSSDNKADVMKKYVDFEFKKQGKALDTSGFDTDRLMALGNRILSKASRS
jgi:hypothetical protein